MVATVDFPIVSNITDSDGLSGVVRITNNGFYGTGTLLYDGRAILTAAHLVSGVNAESISVEIDDELRNNLIFSVSNVLVYPEYDDINANGDLAIIWLDDFAPSDVSRFNLYHQTIEVGDPFLMVGYGLNGSASSGTVSTDVDPLKMKASNTFDLNSVNLPFALEGSMSWSLLDNALWLADFDNGYLQQDTLGYWTGLNQLGLGVEEGLIAPGDSGGPAFINGQLAGVASYLASLPAGNREGDVDSIINSSFGEVGFWQSVNYFDTWIDQAIRQELPNQPTLPLEVKRLVLEGDSGSSYAYFMVNFNGDPALVEGPLQLDYRTLDGTALAGQDYISTTGTLVFYPGEVQAIIPVEILGDTIIEEDESFYMEVFNPLGGSFANGATSLLAIKTILNDDVLL